MTELDEKWAYDMSDPETNALVQGQLTYAEDAKTEELVMPVTERIIGAEWVAEPQSLGDMDNFSQYQLRLAVRTIACGKRQLVDHENNLLRDREEHQDIGQRVVYRLNGDEFATLCFAGMYDHPQETWRELHDNLIGMDFKRYATVEEISGVAKGLDTTLGKRSPRQKLPFTACILAERGSMLVNAATKDCDLGEKLNEVVTQIQDDYDAREAVRIEHSVMAEEPIEQKHDQEIVIKRQADLSADAVPEKPTTIDGTTKKVEVNRPAELDDDDSQVKYHNDANREVTDDLKQLTEKPAKSMGPSL